VDLTGSKLDIVQSNALRQLQYGPSIKIGMLFTETWWTTGVDKDGEAFNIVGGQSYTDLPIRTVVYPSYGAYTDEASKTLIASYCWTNDAERLGSLIGTGKANFDDQLEFLVLNNLAAVHNVTYEYLKGKLVKVHSWDWSHSPYTMGAFAFFGPGNFDDMYTSLSRPAADDKLHFAGEALSVRHAWVVGALDSAWRAVHNYLFLTDPTKLTQFYALWGKNAEWSDDTVSRGGLGGDPTLLESYLKRTHHAF
jgi:monoamine oxidase